ncbi:lipopolysaccharide biosynthesis protein [Pseudazoarcus pumilus]|uniref:Polysaccharide biosynthesis protein n=1 Tax=Pseudazoarcus pumilus TaxID=2067960 RepID=A0A2I6S8X1_9RHOO|nr:lipopolysaccharide biosynthesis protein [Pseudazoarcus pumilus]AUN95709.1 hypothetical protein C0099_12670 [Pseudazoarcus pumilus]
MSGAGALRAMAAQGAGAAACALVSFALVAWLARALGAEQFGAYVVVLNAAILAGVLIEGGWPTLVYRESVGRPGRVVRGDTACAAGMANVLIVGAILAGIGLTGNWAWKHAPTFSVAVLCLSLVGVMNLASARMRGAGRFELEAGWQFGGRVVSAILIVAALTTLPAAGSAVVFAAWAAGLLLWVAFFGRSWLVRPNFAAGRQARRSAFALMLLAGASIFLLRADMVLLELFGAEPVTLSAYAAVTRFVEAAVLLFAPLTNVLLRVFRLAAADSARFGREVAGWAALAGVLAMLGWAAGWLLAEPIVVLVFGEGFRQAHALIPWVLLVLPPLFVSLVLIQAWIALERDRQLALALWACAAAMVGFAAVGWWGHGAKGFAAGVALAHAVLAVALAGGISVRRLKAMKSRG